MADFWIELRCPKHGLERFKIKVIKKYNLSPSAIMPKFRTRPTYELNGLIVGRSVDHDRMTDFLVQYFREAGFSDRIVSIRLRV